MTVYPFFTLPSLVHLYFTMCKYLNLLCCENRKSKFSLFMTFKVDSYRKPLQNCFKTYKYCDNTREYCTCRWPHFSSFGPILVSITAILTSIVTILASIKHLNLVPISNFRIWFYKSIIWQHCHTKVVFGKYVAATSTTFKA